jgi:hypothetical protein
MRKSLLLIPLLLLIITVGCVSPETSPSTPVTTTVTTLPPPIATPSIITTTSAVPILDNTVTVARDTYLSWELTLAAGKRYAVEVVTDGAPVDLLVLDLANYQKFSIAFSSKTGTPWEEYALLTTGIVRDRVEFKAPRSGKYRIIIENADYISGGAVTTRDVNVQVRVYNLD